MAAARVLNPVVLTEFCKMRASPANVSRNLPCGRQINRIKRDLFGQANSVETNKIFNEELEKYQERATKKWGFDFRSGAPLSTNTQFVWERVSFQESSFAPEMYTLTRAAHVRPTEATPHTAMDLLLDERAERENYLMHTSTDAETDSCDDSQDESMAVFKLPANVATSSQGKLTSSVVATSTASAHCNRTQSTSTIQLRKRQPRITEFMKERKRLVQAPKKLSPPAKRMRTSSGSSGVTAAPNNAHTHSISTHFTLRSLQRFK